MPATPLRAIAPKLPAGILYGGDYNPEQWPEEVWTEDARLMRECGVNLVSLAIFSWAKLEPTAGNYDFGWLDRVIEKLWSQGVSVCLATATASPPAWLSQAYPDSLPVDANGVRLSQGSRQHYCPNSRAYRNAGAALIRKLAERYGGHPAVALWHLNNEIGCHVNECCCDVCAENFRRWLRRRYRSIEAVNEAWGTAFWSQHYAVWEEILPPRATPTFRNPGHVLDYKRFMSDSMRDVLIGEITAIRSVVPEGKVTTNGLTFPRQTDYWEWYRYMDIAAWDSYPDPATGLTDIRGVAFCHDLFRSLRGGQPFILMEQASSQVNWRPVNMLKAPGQMRALSYAAMARGADGVMFFQWRASKAGAEKFHSAMVPHVGTENSRVHREVRELGAELKKLAVVAGARTKARVALVVSWENRWALELESKPMAFDYQEMLFHYYFALWDLNVPVDVVHPSAVLDNYDVVIAPALYQMTRGQADNLRAFVKGGGALVMSYFSGVADERDHIWLGGYPALLKDVLGLVVEEWQPLPAGEANALTLPGKSQTVRCEKFCELLHLHGAEAIATYAQSWFAGRAAVTSHCFGEGEACYVATHPERGWLKDFLGGLLRARGIAAPVRAGDGVEAAVRSSDDADFLFVINHQPTPASIDLLDWNGTDLLGAGDCAGKITLEPFGVRSLRRTR